MTDLTQWKPCPLPQRVPLEGAWCRLEPLEAARHGDQPFEPSMAPGADARFRYLFESPCDRVEFDRWLARAVAADDPLAFAVIDRASGRCEGRQTLMRITPDHGVIEIGSILWGPAISRSRVATEALYLFARYAFETLGYRRFEWKCNSLNAPSIRAAGRFGFRYEGQFRQHMVTKGANRDTHWFSMLDTEWPALRAAFDRWLAPENFDAQGRQRATLESFRT